jgi:hypothetical protein
MCAFSDAPIISIAQGAELLARYGCDVRTAGVVPLELGNCLHRKYLRGVKPGRNKRMLHSSLGTRRREVDREKLNVTVS